MGIQQMTMRPGRAPLALTALGVVWLGSTSLALGAEGQATSDVAASSEPAEPLANADGAVEEPPPVEPAVTEWEPTPEPVAASGPTIENAGGALEVPRPPTPFDRGRIRVSVALGWASVGPKNWLILGGGAGYNVIDGLELGADTTFWLGNSPFLATLTPGVRYTFHMVPVVKPYVGTFYRHYFISDDYSDSDSLGARAGVNLMAKGMSYIGLGAVYEHFLDSSLYDNPDQFYPELVLAFAF
jgi:hypothetical protein